MIIIAPMRVAAIYFAVMWMWNLYFRIYARARGKVPPDWSAWVRFELEYLCPAALLFIIATDWDMPIVGKVMDVLMVFCWWLARRYDRDDDRWKRRLERGTGYVRRLYNRLIIVPAGGET